MGAEIIACRLSAAELGAGLVFVVLKKRPSWVLPGEGVNLDI